LSGDRACIGVGFQRCDDLGALFRRNDAPFPRCGGETDACLSGDLADGMIAHAADLSGDRACVGVGFQRHDDLGAHFRRNDAPFPRCGGETDACLSGDPADRRTAHAADLSGDRACVGVGFQRRDDLGALFGWKLFHLVEISQSIQLELNSVDGCCEWLSSARAKINTSGRVPPINGGSGSRRIAPRAAERRGQPVTILHASFDGRRRGQVLRGQPLGAPQGQSARPWLAALRPHHSRRFSLQLAHPDLADGQGCSSSCNQHQREKRT
jgi:hypothetical protein